MNETENTLDEATVAAALEAAVEQDEANEKFTLSAAELRVLGCLIEKERTTPDYYPLTLKALTTACNQKSNREPVMELSEAAAQDALASLGHHSLAREKGSMQTARYAHMLNRVFELNGQEIALLCVLFLRGPQTAGELRTRTGRMCEFESVDEAELVLDNLAERENGPNNGGFVVKLPRQPGKREQRYAHLLAGEVPTDTTEDSSPTIISGSQATEALEARVTALETELAELREKLSALLD